MDERKILVIGNSEYERLKELKAPHNDAKKLFAVLTNPGVGGFKSEHEGPMLDAKVSEAKRELGKLFTEATSEHTLLVYFSGHGILDTDGELYFAMNDTDVSHLYDSAIESDFLRKLMSKSSSRRQIIILDCCYGAKFTSGFKSGATAIDLSEYLGGKGSGKYILSATSGLEYAWEEKEFAGTITHSIFTRYLIKGLLEGKADLRKRGWISLNEWFEYAELCTLRGSKKANRAMRPVKHGFHGQQDIFIARNPNLAIDLVVARESNNTLVSYRLPLFKSSDDSVYTTPALYTLPNQSKVRLTLVRQNESSETMEHIVWDKQIKVVSNSYTLSFVLDKNGYPTQCTLKGAKILKQRNNTSAPIPSFEIPFRRHSVDLLFLIDATMSNNEANLPIEFLNTLFEKLLTVSSCNVGMILYGEYDSFKDGSRHMGRSKFPFTYKVFNLVPIDIAKTYVDQIEQQLSTMGFAGQDFCDALELGLEVAANEIEWHSEIKHVLLIGNSPPHPIKDEAVQFGLLDYSTDEFRDLNWLDLARSLEAQGIVISSFFVSPDISLDEKHQKYIDYVWRTLNGDEDYSVISDYEVIDIITTSLVEYVASRVHVAHGETIRLPIVYKATTSNQ